MASLEVNIIGLLTSAFFQQALGKKCKYFIFVSIQFATFMLPCFLCKEIFFYLYIYFFLLSIWIKVTLFCFKKRKKCMIIFFQFPVAF